MVTVWGWVIIVLGGLAWGGQVISALFPKWAARFGLQEQERDVDPVFFVDAAGEAVWDALVLWTLPLAGVLALLGKPSWPYFGITGGAMFVYFAGRGIIQRLGMRRRGIRIGKPGTLTVYYLFLFVWGWIGLITILVGAASISSL